MPEPAPEDVNQVMSAKMTRVVLFRLPLAISTGTFPAENRLHPREINFSNKSIGSNIKTNKVM